jgi:hypothetical protein
VEVKGETGIAAAAGKAVFKAAFVVLAAKGVRGHKGVVREAVRVDPVVPKGAQGRGRALRLEIAAVKVAEVIDAGRAGLSVAVLSELRRRRSSFLSLRLLLSRRTRVSNRWRARSS